MGTVAYMSPEQARGKMVDARSDIFSFGSMLYQMATGRLPFIGENDIDVVGSILHKEPRPLNQSARPIPHDVELLIKKALRKNREERYQTMRELLADLKDIREELRLDSKNGHKSNGNGTSAVALSERERGLPTEKMNAAAFHSTQELSMAPSTLSGILMSEIKAHPVRSVAYTFLLIALMGGLSYAAFTLFDNWSQPESFQSMRLAKLTYTGNVESFNAAISPDGKYFAYVVAESGEEGLSVKQTATDSVVSIVPPGPNNLTGVAFSPDSNFVYYSMTEKDGQSALFQAPALGGPSRRLIANAEKNVTFSPDGKTLAFIRNSAFLMLADAVDGGNVRQLAKAADGNRYINLAWSPKGDSIATVYFSQTDSNDHLSKVSIADGSEKPVESNIPWLRLRGVAWLPDASALVISGRDFDTQASQLWQINQPGGATRRITNDLSLYTGATVTKDGKSILSIQENYLSNIWFTKADGKPSKITSELGRDEGMSGVAIAPDGTIAYTVRVKGDQDIWKMNSDGTGGRQLTFNSKANFSPVFSPSGRHLIFVSTRGGSQDIWRTDTDGGNPMQLTNSPEQDFDPFVSPDGKFVYYHALNNDRKSTVWRVLIDGGVPEQLTRFSSRKPILSPDGKFFICETRDLESEPLLNHAVVAADGGSITTSLVLPLIARSRVIRWSADGKGLIYVQTKDRVDNLWLQPIDGGTPTQLTNFESDRIFRFDVSADGKSFAMARGNENSDVVLITNFR
jgi:Tol biopolymer transport system component